MTSHYFDIRDACYWRRIACYEVYWRLLMRHSGFKRPTRSFFHQCYWRMTGTKLVNDDLVYRFRMRGDRFVTLLGQDKAVAHLRPETAAADRAIHRQHHVRL